MATKPLSHFATSNFWNVLWLFVAKNFQRVIRNIPSLCLSRTKDLNRLFKDEDGGTRSLFQIFLFTRTSTFSIAIKNICYIYYK